MCASIRLQYLPVVKKMAKGRKFVQLDFLMVYPSGSQPLLYRGTLLNSLNFRGTPITKHEHFLLIKPFCYKIIKNKEDQIKGILFM